MRFFFRSRQFKIILGIFCSLLMIGVVLFAVGGTMSPQSNVLGSIMAPFQQGAAAIKNAIADYQAALNDGQELMKENSRLRSEIDELKNQLAEYQEQAHNAEIYAQYLGIKEQNPDFEMLPATILARDIDDPFGSFTINQGSINGVSLYDPVITPSGVVGYVSEVSMAYCKVTTILSPQMKIAAMARRTADIGVVSGTVELAEQGDCRMYNLASNNAVSLGDFVVTSGGGIFPKGLMIGSVSDVRSEKTDVSVYAVVEPAAEIENLREVMIITYFFGQGEGGSINQ